MFKRIKEDIATVKDRDPAAASTISVLINYPGLQASWAHRFEHWMWRHGRKGIARFSSQVTRFITGIEIHPGATIGRRMFIDHGLGVVIGETTILGDDVTIYQGVTLGGTGKECGKRHPTIGNRVVVGVGAAVLGNITVGDDSRVGAGAVVVDDVPARTTVIGIPGHVVSRDGERVELIDLHHENLPDPVVAMIRRMQHRIDRLEQRVTLSSELSAESAVDSDEVIQIEEALEEIPHCPADCSCPDVEACPIDASTDTIERSEILTKKDGAA